MGQESSAAKDLSARVANLRESFGKLPLLQLRDPEVIALYEGKLAKIIKELDKLIADKKVKEGEISVVQLKEAIVDLAETLEKWGDVAAQAQKQFDPETGAELERVTSALLVIIEPGSTALNDDSFLAWMTIHDSSPEELQAAGRRVRRYREIYKDYAGPLQWIAAQRAQYSDEQVEHFYNICATPSAEDQYLKDIRTLLNDLDRANKIGMRKFEQDLVLGRDFTKEEKEAQDKIAVASSALLEFLRANSSRFAHVKILGNSLEDYLIQAMKTGKCNNDLVAIFRKALTADYNQVPRFVKIYMMLDAVGYFAQSGEL